MKYLIIFSFLLFCQSKAYPQPVVSHFEVFFFDKDKPTKEYFEMYQEHPVYPFDYSHDTDSTYLKKFFKGMEKSSYCIFVKRLNSYYLRNYKWGIFGLTIQSSPFPNNIWNNSVDKDIEYGGAFGIKHTAGRDDQIFDFENAKDEPVMGFTGYIIPKKLLLQKQTQIKSDELMKFSFVLHYPKLNQSNSPFGNSKEGYIKERSKKIGVSFKKGTHLQLTMKTDETLLVEEDTLLDEYITFEF